MFFLFLVCFPTIVILMQWNVSLEIFFFLITEGLKMRHSLSSYLSGFDCFKKHEFKLKISLSRSLSCLCCCFRYLNIYFILFFMLSNCWAMRVRNAYQKSILKLSYLTCLWWFALFQINTNGFVSFDKPPAEEVYLGKMPAAFQMIAALLGDLDNSAGQGAVYFRQDNGSDILSQVSSFVKQGFPGETIDEPQHAVVVTWENMSARDGAQGRGDGLDTKVQNCSSIVFIMHNERVDCLSFPDKILVLFLPNNQITLWACVRWTKDLF